VSGDDYDDLPTARSTLRARYVTLLVWCKGGCQHQAEADLHGLVASGLQQRVQAAGRSGRQNPWLVAQYRRAECLASGF
jgi:hypothetical protein